MWIISAWSKFDKLFGCEVIAVIVIKGGKLYAIKGANPRLSHLEWKQLAGFYSLIGSRWYSETPLCTNHLDT